MEKLHSISLRLTGLLILIVLVSACTNQVSPPIESVNSPEPLESNPAGQEDYFQSSGGADPRTSGYWLLWNSCADGNQSAAAKANGGREAGWIILDDLLADPGVLIGRLQVKSCAQAVSLLQIRDLAGGDRSNDPAYQLASQLLAAQLNLATGSEYCRASDEAVSAGQLLLLGLDFNATTSYLGPPRQDSDIQTAVLLIEQLTNYNLGALCR